MTGENSSTNSKSSPNPIIQKLSIILFLISGFAVILSIFLAGYKFWQKQNQPAFSSTAGWRTYANTQNNFSIKYPPAWSVRELPNDPFVYFSASAPRTEQIALQVFSNPSHLPIKVWLDQEVGKELQSGSQVVKTPIEIGKFNAWRVEGLPTGPWGGLDYFVELDDQIIALSAGPYFRSAEKKQRTDNKSPGSDDLQSITETMLSTLKFLE